MIINFNIDEFKDTILPIYRQYLEDYTCRINVFYGGAGSGKSVFVTQKLIFKLLKSKRKCLVVRKVGATIRASIFEEFKARLEEMDITKYCNINKSDMTIELPNGSIFLFRGLDDQEKIKSISGIDDIIIEEATELIQDDFEQLNLRLRSKKKYQQIHLMFNPVSKQNWVYSYFKFDTNEPIKSCKIVKSTYRDNIYLPKAYILNMERLKETNYSWWKIYANGEFSTLDKRVFTNWEVKDFNVEEIKISKCRELAKEYGQDNIIDFPASNPLYKKAFNRLNYSFALDFGWNDPVAFIGILVDIDNKNIWIFDEHYERFMTNEDIAKMVKYKGYSKERIICDSANPKDIDDLQKKGLTKVRAAKKGKDSIMNGIRRLQQFKIYVHPYCENTIVELENYTWQKDKRTGLYIDKPIDKYCHLMDALRYSTEYIDSYGKYFNRAIYGI
jgi:phage terminase large subunit